MIKYILTDKSGKDFITHNEQEKDGLKFSVTPVENGLSVVTVEGADNKIKKWKDKVKGTEIDVATKDTYINNAIKLGLQTEIPILEAELANKQSQLTALGGY